MHRSWYPLALSITALLASACSGGLPPEVLASIDGPVDTAPINDTAGIPLEIVDELNASVPAGQDIVFAPHVLIDAEEPEYVIIAALPTGWAQASDKFVDAPYFADGIAGSPQIALAPGCQGFCSPQDWSELMADPEAAVFASTKTEGTIMAEYDLAGPEGKAEIFQPDDSDRLKITIARWDNSADKFLWCRAEVGVENADIASTLADACAVAVAGWIG